MIHTTYLDHFMFVKKHIYNKEKKIYNFPNIWFNLTWMMISQKELINFTINNRICALIANKNYFKFLKQKETDLNKQ